MDNPVPNACLPHCRKIPGITDRNTKNLLKN